MAKIENDKYYTPTDLAKRLINKTYKIIGEENISEVIEPSAGNGNFSLQIPSVCWAYDIEPEHDSIIKQDFLTLDCKYLYGRLIIGNPPFGTRNTLSVKFFKKAIQLGDYVAFIQPISQLDNNIQMYEFNLVYSEDLGLIKYSDRKLHCCFNIYKRPANGEFNCKPNYKLKDVEIKEYRNAQHSKNSDINHDLRLCNWGASIGTIVEHQDRGKFAHEMGITIKNKSQKEGIIKILKITDWKNVYKFIATPTLYQWQIYKLLKEQIPELE